MNNREIIDFINLKEYIRDNTIIDIRLAFRNEINISLIFKSRNLTTMELSFLNVKSFNLSGSNDFDDKGILVTHYKFFISDTGLVYFSIDPFDEEKVIDENDNNFILSELIKLFIE